MQVLPHVTGEWGPREATVYTHLCQASQQGGWRRPESSRPLAEPKLAKFLGLFCSPHRISQDSPRNRTKSFSLPLFSRGGTGASVTLPLITRPPPLPGPRRLTPQVRPRRSRCQGELRSGVAGAVWVSVSLLWAWGHLGFTDSPRTGTLPLQSPGQGQAHL